MRSRRKTLINFKIELAESDADRSLLRQVTEDHLEKEAVVWSFAGGLSLVKFRFNQK